MCCIQSLFILRIYSLKDKWSKKLNKRKKYSYPFTISTTISKHLLCGKHCSKSEKTDKNVALMQEG